jgi:putative DNA primase/helicase
MPVNLTHDGSLDIATGKSRKETSWKNKNVKWSQLLDKLSTTHRTHETFAEYLGGKKSWQDNIKDIGGFVGGYLSGGRRKNGSMLHRQLLTLDLDFAKTSLWDEFTLFYDCAACLYSTHKHEPSNPRYRLIIPLDREVVPDEYIAIARRIAGNLGIDLFDDTTFEPVRLMYWPSTSKDGQYEFCKQDGPWLSADEMLASYQDWRDSSEWPVSSRVGEVIRRNIKKQGDPLEKPGLVGAFCRTYTIHEAIELFLPDIYEACSIEDRYTYKEGSTSGGLVTYDDKFAFSHHGTDVASGRLCNAFDLVRLHKFGLKDEDCKPDVPVNKLPSYLAMCDFTTADKKIMLTIGEERLAKAKDDFDGVDVRSENVAAENEEGPEYSSPETSEDSKEWLSKLEADRKGNYYPTIDNIVLVLENDPAFKANMAFDEFEQRAVLRRHLPWRKVVRNTRYLTDRDASLLEHHLEKNYKISSSKLDKALDVIFERHNFHPVRQYLNGLKWDSMRRVDTILIDYLGAEDNEYVRAVTRKTLVAAVARVYRPGVKFDCVLSPIGKQGMGKSTLFKKLGKQWFTDTFNFHMLQGKEGYEQIRGAWMVEIGELAGLPKIDIERVKGFISAAEDRYRQAYGKRVEIFPRQNIFIGPGNKPDPFKDQSGNRRFWPVLVDKDKATKDLFTDLTNEEVNQVWAEAVSLYRGGETLFLDGNVEVQAIAVQRDHTEEHPWTGIIAEYLEKKLPDGWDQMGKYARIAFLRGEDELQPTGITERTKVCVPEIWTEALERRETIDSYNANIIKDIMRNIPGWTELHRQIRYGNYGPQRKGFMRDKTGVPKGVPTPYQGVPYIEKNIFD